VGGRHFAQVTASVCHRREMGATVAVRFQVLKGAGGRQLQARGPASRCRYFAPRSGLCRGLRRHQWHAIRDAGVNEGEISPWPARKPC